MKNIHYILLASTISFIACADTITIENKTDSKLQVGIIQTQKDDEGNAKIYGSSAKFIIINPNVKANVQRLGIEKGIDRYVVALVVNDQGITTSNPFQAGAGKDLNGLFKPKTKHFNNLQTIKQRAKASFGYGAAGYMNGKNFVVTASKENGLVVK